MLGSIVSPLDGFRSPFGPPRGFNPARLFGPTDTGWFYDPSDMSTLFQDAAGTTPVTGVNQPVGLVLDKSKGLVELFPDGTFSQGISQVIPARDAVISWFNSSSLRVQNTIQPEGQGRVTVNTVPGVSYVLRASGTNDNESRYQGHARRLS